MNRSILAAVCQKKKLYENLKIFTFYHSIFPGRDKVNKD